MPKPDTPPEEHPPQDLPSDAEVVEQEPPGTDPDRNWVNQELELLISAAIVFTLFQLPGALDAAFLRVDRHVGPELGLVTFMPYYVGKLVVYGLIATFTLHFLMRSLWVALLGLQSAYPRGIRWERLKLGPVALEVNRDLPSLEHLEERVDRMASSLFAFLFIFLAMMGVATLWAAVAGLVAYLLARWLWPQDPGRATGLLFFALMGLFALLSTATALLDRALGSKHGHRFPGWVSKLVRLSYAILHRAGPNRLYLPIFFTLSSSRISRNRLNLMVVLFVYGLIGVFLVGMMAERGVLRLDSYSYYPDRTGAWGMDARHYDSLRQADLPASVPSLSSDVVDGPYLRLFIPYDVDEDNERIEALCRSLSPLHGAGLRLRSREAPPEERFRAILGCLDEVYRVSLDGEPLDDPGWVFYTHPAGNVRGWAAYLPTAEMAPGRHLLVVEHVPLPRPEDETGGEEAESEEAESEEAESEEAEGGESEGEEEAGSSADDSPADDSSTDEHDPGRDEHHMPFWK